MNFTSKFLVCSIACAFIPLTYAGTIGNISADSFTSGRIVPFASFEAFPVWVSYSKVRYDDAQYNQVLNYKALSGGVRGAAGILYAYKPNLDLTAEAGWNYFGSANGNLGSNSAVFTDKISASGVDGLVGVTYKQNNKFEWFAKGGALFQIIRQNMTYVGTNGSSGNNTYNLAYNLLVLDVLPEVKVGLNYNISQNWGASFSYMHAFGSSPSIALSTTTSDGPLSLGQPTTLTTYNANLNLQGATLDAVQLGIHYLFR